MITRRSFGAILAAVPGAVTCGSLMLPCTRDEQATQLFTRTLETGTLTMKVTWDLTRTCYTLHNEPERLREGCRRYSVGSDRPQDQCKRAGRTEPGRAARQGRSRSGQRRQTGSHLDHDLQLHFAIEVGRPGTESESHSRSLRHPADVRGHLRRA